jgi:very-short-patch-repair endonuclease
VYSYNKKLVSNAQELRKNMTAEERHLWYDFLKKLPIPVKRQKNIENYILDFYIPSAKLAIEIDGRQHKLAENRKDDRIRDEFLNSLGIAVVRYTNDDIRDRFQAVAKDILNRLGLGYEDLKHG